MHWSAEKDIHQKNPAGQSRMEALKVEEAKAQREGNLAKAAEIPTDSW